MTTVVYRDGILASDSAVWDGADYSTMAHKTKKLFRLKDGSIVGIYGTLHTCLNLIAYLNGDEKPGRLEGASAIVVKPSGRIICYEGATQIPVIKARYIAAGSGASVALGALFQGANAMEAVKAAIYHDSGSRGPVRSLTLIESTKRS